MSFLVAVADLSSAAPESLEAEPAAPAEALDPPQPARTAEAATVPKAARNSRRFIESFMGDPLPLRLLEDRGLAGALLR